MFLPIYILHKLKTKMINVWEWNKINHKKFLFVSVQNEKVLTVAMHRTNRNVHLILYMKDETVLTVAMHFNNLLVK